HDAILVRGPRGSGAAQQRRSGTLFPAEAEGPVAEARDEPLEADRHLVEPPAELRAHPIDHAAAHNSLPDPGVRAPLRPMREEMLDSDREIMIGRQEPRAPRDDPMPIVIRIAGEGDVEAVP